MICANFFVWPDALHNTIHLLDLSLYLAKPLTDSCGKVPLLLLHWLGIASTLSCIRMMISMH